MINYHNITKSDMLNGSGLRVVLWLSHCEHYCKNCQNPQTWDKNSGIEFDDSAKQEIYDELSKDYISGITFSGGDPLSCINRSFTLNLCKEIKHKFPSKNIWVYTGYEWEEIKDLENLSYVDILVDGKFIEELADSKIKWCGSSNQKIIDVKKSLELQKVIELQK